MQPAHAGKPNILTDWSWYTRRISAAESQYVAAPSDAKRRALMERVDELRAALPDSFRSAEDVRATFEKIQKADEASAKAACQALDGLIGRIANLELENEDDRCRAVLVAASRSPLDILFLAKQFNITSYTLLNKLLLEYFKNLSEDDKKLIRSKSEEERYQFAKDVAKRSDGAVAYNFALFDLNDEHRNALAEQIVSIVPFASIKCFKSFNIKDEGLRFKCALRAAGTNPETLAEHIADYNLSEWHRVDVALKALKSPFLKSNPLNLTNFALGNVTVTTAGNVTDRLTLLGMSRSILGGVWNQLITDQSSVRDNMITCTVDPEFAGLLKELDAEANPKIKRESIQFLGYVSWKYHKKSSAEKQTLAHSVSELLALKDPDLRMRAFCRFSESEIKKANPVEWTWFTNRIDDAKKQYETTPTADNKRLLLDRVNELRYALPNSISKSPEAVRDIENFEKSDEASAKQACHELSNLVDTLACDKLKTEEERYNAAATAAVRSPKDIPLLIKQFQLTNPKYCDELMEEFFKRLTEPDKKQLAGQSEDVRFRFAQQLAIYSPEQVARNFQLFELNPEHRLKIAQLFLSLNLAIFADLFKNFNIENETDRYNFAVLISNKYPHKVEYILPDLKLNEPHRFEIAKILIPQIPLLELKYFRIANVNALIDLLILCGIKKPEAIAGDIKSCQIHVPEAEVNCIVDPEFEALHKQIDGLVDPLAKKESTQFLGYFNWMCRGKSSAERKALEPYAADILSILDPDLRYELADLLFTNGMPVVSASVPKRALLFHMILQPLQKDPEGNTILTQHDWETIFKNLDSLNYKDASKKHLTLAGLCALVTAYNLTPADRKNLLKSVFCKTAPHAPAPHIALLMIKSILKLYKIDLLKQKPVHEADEKETKEQAASPFDFPEIMRSIFVDSLKVKPQADFKERYEATFGKARYPHGILYMASSFKHLDKATECLTRIATAILEGRYHEMRYETPPGSHMEAIFKGREDLKKEWMAGETLHLQHLDQSLKSSIASTMDPRAVLAQISEKESTFTRLAHCLSHPQDSESKLEELAKESAAMAKEVKIDLALKPQLNALKLEIELIKLLACKDAKTRLALINKILPFLVTRYGDQAEQTVNFRKLLSEKTLADYTVEDTDAWEDMMLIGTEISASCMQVYGGYAEYLLGCMADGKTRAVVVKKGKHIIARSLITLLLDPSGKPVLVQQAVFTTPNPTPNMIDQVNEMSKRRARKLGIPFVQLESDFKKWMQKSGDYTDNLRSIGCPAPYESIETPVGGIKGNGVYTIEKNLLRTVDLSAEAEAKRRSSSPVAPAK